MSRNLYLILGVAETATEGEVKRAYRRLARKYHPDINPGNHAAEQHFKRIVEAYEVLSNPDKRGFYDAHGYYSEGILEGHRDVRWDFSFRAFDDVSAEGGAGSEDEFVDFISQLRSSEENAATDDVECHVSISFDEAVRGHRTEVEVDRKRFCEKCEGSGKSAGGAYTACRECSGSGQLIRARGRLRFSMTCLRCAGSGRVPVACSQCLGEGRVRRVERLRVALPAGVSSGSRVRIPGQGHASGDAPGQHGDLYVITHVADHPFFKRVGDNIQCKVPITVTEAALGAKVRVPTIDGEAVLRIPPGVQTGRTLRLRGKGAPSLRAAGARGDQYVEVSVVVPQVRDERSKDILREFARLNPQDPREDLITYAG